MLAAALWGLSLAAAPSVSGAPAQQVNPEERPLVLLTEAAHPPYAYFTAKGDISGFEIELMKALCARIRRSCLFKHKEFDRLVPALLGRKGDAIVSGLEINEERREKFTLSRPYFRMPVLMIARKDAMPGALTSEALADSSIGALRDSPFAALAADRFPKAELDTYATQIEVNLDLAASRIDLAIGDELSLRDWLKAAPEAGCCAAAGRVADPRFIAGEGFAVVMRKGDDELKSKLDTALEAERADGSYAAIAREYFGFDLP